MEGRGKFEFNIICHYCGGSDVSVVCKYGGLYIVCDFCETIGPNGWLVTDKIRPGFLSSELHAGMDEEVSGEEESPFDTTRTIIDEDGNTLVWDREREIYVNCGVQHGR